jgi:dTMP kinase
MLIALEGIDGVGKTTSCNLLQERLSIIGKASVIHDPALDEPIGQFVVERRLQTEPFDASIWAMLYSCSSINLQSGKKGYLKQIELGNTIILDRTILSTYAYYFGKCSFQWLDEIHKPYKQPDLTIILDLDINENHKRLQTRDVGKEIPSIVQLQKLKESYRQSYLHLLNQGINIKYINVTPSDDKIDVLTKIQNLINNHFAK